MKKLLPYSRELIVMDVLKLEMKHKLAPNFEQNYFYLRKIIIGVILYRLFKV